MEPGDEALDDGDGKRLGQRDKEKGSLGIVGQQLLSMSHPLAKVKQIVHERVFFFPSAI